MPSIHDELLVAVNDGDRDKVNKLLSLGANPNYVKNYTVKTHNIGMPALMCAIKNNDIDCATLLISAGADVNAQVPSYDDMTALMYAAANQNLMTMRLLLNNKADINRVDKQGRTALFFACDHLCQINIACIRYLLNQGANKDHQDILGNTAMMATFATGLSSGVSKLDALMCLVEQGARIDIENSQNDTVIDMAKRNKDTSIYPCLMAFMEKQDLVSLVRDESSGSPSVDSACSALRF